MDTFPDIGTPDWGLTEDVDASVTKISFGDGYELRQANGINHLRDKWDPVWSFLTHEEALSTYDWLKQRKDLTAFLWNHPDGRQVKVVCKSVSLVRNNYNDDVLSASFVQDFNP
jgi:phage-related protein